MDPDELNGERARVRIKLKPWIRAIAREAALTVLEEHERKCPIRRGTRGLVALIAGSFAAGGIVWTFLANLFTR